MNLNYASEIKKNIILHLFFAYFLCLQLSKRNAFVSQNNARDLRFEEGTSLRIQ